MAAGSRCCQPEVQRRGGVLLEPDAGGNKYFHFTDAYRILILKQVFYFRSDGGLRERIAVFFRRTGVGERVCSIQSVYWWRFLLYC